MFVIEKPIVQELTDKQKQIIEEVEIKLFHNYLYSLSSYMGNIHHILKKSGSQDKIVTYLAKSNIALRIMRLVNPQWRLTTEFIGVFKKIKQYEEKHAINMFARILSVENQIFILEAISSSGNKTSGDRKQEIAKHLVGNK